MQKWLFYDLLLGAAPAILVPFAFWLVRKPRISEILGDGQLFFFCTALAGTTYGALSEIRAKLEHAQQEQANICDAVLVFAILFASFAFGTATMANHHAKARIAETSLWFSLATMILVGCIRRYFNAW